MKWYEDKSYYGLYDRAISLNSGIEEIEWAGMEYPDYMEPVTPGPLLIQMATTLAALAKRPKPDELKKYLPGVRDKLEQIEAMLREADEERTGQ